MEKILVDVNSCLRRELKLDLYSYLVQEWKLGFYPPVEKIAQDFNKFHFESVKILDFSLLLFSLFELYQSGFVRLVVDLHGALRAMPFETKLEENE